MSEPDVTGLLTVDQAIAVIDAAEIPPRLARVALADARGLTLAEDLAADRDYPPFDKSLMDGYAVRTADVSAGNAALRLVGEIAAGKESTRLLEPGETVAIMTGAPMPPGADGVVPIEETAREHGGAAADTVHIAKPIDARRFVARRAADIAAGATVLRRGTRLEAPQIAVAATVGAHHVEVIPRVRAAVLTTGDELVDAGETPRGAQIRNSNGPMLVALLERMGCDVADLGIVIDDKAQIRAAIEEGLQHDVLFVSGGMSMGAYDYVPTLLKELNLDLRITKLRIKPGKPFVFAVKTGSSYCVGEEKSWMEWNYNFVFGLPGNPVSGFVCTVRLASRLVHRLAGRPAHEPWVTAQLAQPLPLNGPREFYQPAQLSRAADGIVTAAPLNWKGSADLFTLANADGLLVRPENDPARAAGDTVRVLEI